MQFYFQIITVLQHSQARLLIPGDVTAPGLCSRLVAPASLCGILPTAALKVALSLLPVRDRAVFSGDNDTILSVQRVLYLPRRTEGWLQGTVGCTWLYSAPEGWQLPQVLVMVSLVHRLLHCLRNPSFQLSICQPAPSDSSHFLPSARADIPL